MLHHIFMWCSVCVSVCAYIFMARPIDRSIACAFCHFAKLCVLAWFSSAADLGEIVRTASGPQRRRRCRRKKFAWPNRINKFDTLKSNLTTIGKSCVCGAHGSKNCKSSKLHWYAGFAYRFPVGLGGMRGVLRNALSMPRLMPCLWFLLLHNSNA